MVPVLPHAPLDRRAFLGVGGVILGGLGVTDAAEPAPLPAGVKAVWGLEKAHCETTGTRERVCLNGLFDVDAAVLLLRRMEEARAEIRSRGKFGDDAARDKILAIYDETTKELVRRIGQRGP